MDSHSGAWCERSVSLADLERLAAAVRLADLDLVARLELERRDVGRDAVDREMAVADELAGLRPGRCEAHPEDDVVEAELERAGGGTRR